MDISNSKSSIIFDKDTKAGEKVKLKSKDKCYAIFAAPGQDMSVTEQDPPSELTIFIKRSKILNDKELNVIPDPVFEPHYEKNINHICTTNWMFNNVSTTFIDWEKWLC
ncbi:hypothetical protein [Acinetobacter sp. UBA6526]|uniref:hypothetical protein n=1 Tax=Acinetobacter sp. UBA6526 TaxID=1945950 RepID=UPI0025805D2E|nr:hypothetical protein [Acinetobacter sp. UBA6526]